MKILNFQRLLLPPPGPTDKSVRKPFNYSKLSFHSDEGNRRFTENVVLSLYLFRSDTITFKLLQEQLASKWLRAYKYKQFIEKENFKVNCKSLRKSFSCS